MKITKQQILKMIQEEISEELSENFLSRLFGFGKDKEDEKPKAEPEPEEPEEDPGCQDPQAVLVTEYDRLKKALAPQPWGKKYPDNMKRDMQSYGGPIHPLRIVQLLGEKVIEEGVEILQDKNKMREFGRQFMYDGDKYQYWKYSHRINDVPFYGTYYFDDDDLGYDRKRGQETRSPCIEGSVVQKALYEVFSVMSKGEYDDERQKKRPEREYGQGRDHLISFYEGGEEQGISKLEEMIRKEISKIINDPNKEDE